MAAHGAQKLFGWFGGHGLEATAIALGLFGPLGPAIMLAVMVVAAISVHWKNGLFGTSNGIEIPLLCSTAAVGLALGVGDLLRNRAPDVGTGDCRAAG